VALLERACEAIQQAGKELSEDETLHISNSTVSFSSNCRMHTGGKNPVMRIILPAFLLNGSCYAVNLA